MLLSIAARNAGRVVVLHMPASALAVVELHVANSTCKSTEDKKN
jgi:hypothetical protein